MFDTVTLVAFDIDINPNRLNGIIPFTYLNDAGEYISKYTFTKEKIKYEYSLQKRFLKIEFSIPKLIYSTNTKIITESDIEGFWSKLYNTLHKHLSIYINKEQWIVKRLDVSYNFKVDDVGEYIKEISKKTISKKTKITYNENETVIFKNKSSSICFYDKEKECINGKEPKEVIEQAKGILRLEIRPSTYHIREYSHKKRAIDLITREFFTYIIGRFNVNELLKFQDEQNRNELFKALNVMKVADIEKVIAFNRIVEIVGEKTLIEKGYYKDGTFRNRKELVAEYNKNINQKGTKQKQLYIKLG